MGNNSQQDRAAKADQPARAAEGPKGKEPGGVLEMFRAYDIRGVHGEALTEDAMERIGRAFSASVEGETAVVARDARASGRSLSRAFIDGVRSGGRSVQDLGVLPLGVGMFHAWKGRMTFAYVTASHLPKQWNGLKFFWSSAVGFMDQDLDEVRENFLGGLPKEVTRSRRGSLSEPGREEAIASYIGHLKGKLSPERPLRIALDPGNGAAGVMARDLFSSAGFEVTMLNEDPDGTFPNRSPDPVEDPLSSLSEAAKDHYMGIAYDGDGDRMVVMDESGRKVTPEQISYLILSELLKEQSGPIVANVEVTRTIERIAGEFGRQVKRIRVGHNYLVKLSTELGACFGVETSGHYSVPWIFPMDDSLAVSFYLSCILSRKERPLSELVSRVPVLPFRRTGFQVPDGRKFQVMDRVREHVRKAYPNVDTLDGIRVDKDSGWALIRASNTGPVIRLTVEGRTRRDLETISKEFTGILERFIKT